MAAQVLQSVWPLLLLLAYFFVKGVLGMLAATSRHAIEKHNRLRECMKLRLEFQRGKEQPGQTAAER